MRAALALAIFGGGVAQNALAPVLSIGEVTPDLPLIVVVLLALRRGPELGCLVGFAAGLFQDAVAGGFIGTQALTKAFIGFLVGRLGGRLWVHEPLVQVPGLVLLSLTEGLARYLLLRFFQFPGAFGDLMLYVVLPQALYNGFLGAALVLLLSWTERLRSRSSWR
jgi:rod shape-determining protein MreD